MADELPIAPKFIGSGCCLTIIGNILPTNGLPLIIYDQDNPYSFLIVGEEDDLLAYLEPPY